MTASKRIAALMIASFACAGWPADAQTGEAVETTEATEATETTEATDGEGEAIGLNLDLGYASAYVFRGWNVFKKDKQLDQHMLVAPGVTWSVPDTGLAVGYWGAFQVSGDNIRENIDAALGAEQDLFASYTWKLGESLSLGVGLTGYLYPFADEAVTGAICPVYLEPLAKVGFATVVDLGLAVSYFLGLQDEPGIRGISYLYLNPTVSKTVVLHERVNLGMKVGYGFKLFLEGNDGANNVHDMLLGATLPIALTEKLYLSPGFTAAWTNVEDVVNPDSGAVDERGFADGIAVLGSLNLGVNL